MGTVIEFRKPSREDELVSVMARGIELMGIWFAVTAFTCFAISTIIRRHG